jgi:hypothetical protein
LFSISYDTMKYIIVKMLLANEISQHAVQIYSHIT